MNDGLIGRIVAASPNLARWRAQCPWSAGFGYNTCQIDGGKWNIICGALNTRDPTEFLAPLAAIAGSVRCLAIPDQPASLSAAEMTDAALALGLDAAPATSIITAFDELRHRLSGYYLRLALSCRSCSFAK